MSTVLNYTSGWSKYMWVFILLFLSVPACAPEPGLETTRLRLNRLAGETTMLLITEHQLPPGGINGLLAKLKANGVFANASLPGVEQGVDYWGRTILLIRGKNGRITFRSLGPDGIDDGGTADDLDVTIEVGKYLTKPTALPPTAVGGGDHPRTQPRRR